MSSPFRILACLCLLGLAARPASANPLLSAPYLAFDTGTFPYCVAIGDLDGDGKPDLAVANEQESTVSVLLASGGGTFEPQVKYVTAGQSYSVAMDDLNGDGKLDLALACWSAGAVSVLLGNGDGTFGAEDRLPRPGPRRSRWRSGT